MWIFVIILKREFMTQWRDTLFFGDVIFDLLSFLMFIQRFQKAEKHE